MSWFGIKKSGEPIRPRVETLNFRARQQRQAETDPVLAQKLIDDDRYNRANVDNGLY